MDSVSKYFKKVYKGFPVFCGGRGGEGGGANSKEGAGSFVFFWGGLPEKGDCDPLQHSNFTSAVGKCHGFCQGISLLYSICLSNKNAEAVRLLEF